jgi:CTP synthase
MTRFVFITGGVTSSLGKGIAAASLGALLQARGFRVRLRKLDPYLNVDPGTLSPYQHGEVFVTEDGAETDLDLGHYERFTGVACTAADYTTTGQLYSSVLAKERQGAYLGATVQIIPHITEAIHAFIQRDTAEQDVVIYEIGGTVGDLECAPYLEAIRTFRRQRPSDCLSIHVTLVPYVSAAKELKTKPTQHSVKTLLHAGIQPDLLLCRCERPLPAALKQKIALFTNVATEDVLAAMDAASIYDVPHQYHLEGLDVRVCQHFGVDLAAHPVREDAWWSRGHVAPPVPDTPPSQQAMGCIRHVAPDTTLQAPTRIAVIGKYVALPDAYLSLLQAIEHASSALCHPVDIALLDSEDPNLLERLQSANGVIIPGGFGERGTAGMIRALTYTRTHGIPTLGICFGMQLMVIEAARQLLGLEDASTTEFGPTPEPVIDLLEHCQDKVLGGSMRLGAQPCHLQPHSQLHRIYQATEIQERHRHRYEVNTRYRAALEAHGMCITGQSPDGLPEAVENIGHPWYIGVQYHPEFQSRPFQPHPLFRDLLDAAAHLKK